MPATLIDHDSVCYLAGVGEDASFDLALVAEFGCDVWSFDPTPRAIAYAEKLAQPKLHFIPVGVWDEVAQLRFYAPTNPDFVSHSAFPENRVAEYFEAEVSPLVDLMARFSHDRIDVLKLDIEGAEAVVLDSLLASEIRPTVLCVEFDAPRGIAAARRQIAALRAAGYDCVNIERHNWSFVFREGR